MQPIILLSEAFLALPHFSTLSHNTIFWKMLLNIKCVLLLSLQPLSETSLILTGK
jgi:hypothetical protein